ncbi:oligosaccharide flippase family protein [Fusobacterium mortiferum]|uniref:oligosaccharide flippase family protein n=1 Tax=Fusobacterium mortiferum TaxID=850 RepID=UPI0022E214E0|nr:oligosaccharide flippase family protein [Fusobacterium mortiferum]
MSVKNNIIWLIFDKIFILILQFVVGVKIANHFGSYQYGKYSYALSIIAFIPMLLELLNTRIIKLYFYKYNFNIIVSIVSTFKNLISIIIFVVILLSKYFFSYDIELYWILVILSLDNIFISMTLGIENYFDYKLQSRYIVVSNNIVKIISYLIQYLAIVFNYGIIMIPVARCIGDILRAFILKYQYRKKYNVVNKIVLNKKIILRMINESILIWLSFISYIIASNIDRIMLKNLLNLESVGIYSIANQLISILLIIIGPFQNTVFSELLKIYHKDKILYEKKYIYFTKILTGLYIVGIPISFFVLQKSFKYVFSPDYSQAISLYMILSLVVLVKANVFLRSSHLVLSNNRSLILKSETIAAIANIFLNYILINKFGVRGAAISTLISQVISLWIVDIFSKEGRKLLKYHLKGFYIFDVLKYK